MEVKYAKNSLTLEQLAENMAKEKMAKTREKRSSKKVFSDEYFKTAEEMIDWVMSGKEIVNTEDLSEWMKLEDGKVLHHFFACTDTGTPLGYLKEHISIEEFKNWVITCEEISEHNHIPVVNEYFIKGC
jgi:hypothetical protein